MGVVQLGYVGFGVSDIPAWEHLADKVLGLRVVERGEDGTSYLRMDEHHHRIALLPTGEDDLVYAGWQVAGPADLEAMEARLRAAGVPLREGTPEEVAHRKVRRLIKFQDPSGIPYEVFYGPRILPRDPFQPARPMSGFKAGTQGLGHLVMKVDSREETERFYTDLLGLKLTDYGSGRIAFMHCNRRHHSVAVGEVPYPKRLIHMMIEVLSLDDLGTAMDLCEREGVPVIKSLGKHPNDHMVSFYMETPSGFELEYGFGAREVDDATWEVESYEPGDVWGHKRVPQAPRETAAQPALVGGRGS